MSELATATRLPEPKEVRDLLIGLLDRPIDLTIADRLALQPGERATYAVYVDDRLGIRAVAVADLPFSGYAGGALGLLPPGGVQDNVHESELTTSLEENFYEVLNISAALMNSEHSPHVKLHAVYTTSEVAPPHVVAMSHMMGRRLDLALTIGGYGRGRFSVVVIA
ncbi:MAG: hypothetical protein M3Y71_09460 [Actinomycetota bacterium]|nr:hypothetical protein [Actinomycetota bacterium]